MSPTQKRRLTTVALLLVGITVTTFLALKAMNSSIEYFFDTIRSANRSH